MGDKKDNFIKMSRTYIAFIWHVLNIHIKEISQERENEKKINKFLKNIKRSKVHIAHLRNSSSAQRLIYQNII